MQGIAEHRVVIIGGGFGGLFAARALRRSDVAITLVDRAQHHLFQPLLYQVATGILSEGQIAAPLRDVLKRHRNVECVLADVVDVDADGPPGRGRAPRRGARHAALRRPGRRRRRAPVLLRSRRVRALGARDEDRRGRARDPPPGVRGVRARRDRDRPRGAAPLAHLRRRRRRPHRGRARRADPRAGHPHPARGVPAASGPRTPGSCCSTAGARRSPPSGRRCRRKAAAALRELGVELHIGSIVTDVDGDGLEVRDRAGTTTRYPAGHRAVGGRCRGTTGGRGARRGHRGRPRPRRAHRGAAGPHDPRSPGDLGRRGPDEPRRRCPASPRWPCSPGSTPAAGSGTGSATGSRCPRSATTTSGRPRTSPAATR